MGYFMLLRVFLSFLIVSVSCLCFSVRATHTPKNIITLEDKQIFWEQHYDDYVKIGEYQNYEIRHIDLQAIVYFWATGKRTVPPYLWPLLLEGNSKTIKELELKGLKVPNEVIKRQNELAREQRNVVASRNSNTTMESLGACAILRFEETKHSINNNRSVEDKPTIKTQKAVEKKSSSQALPTPQTDKTSKAHGEPIKSNSSVSSLTSAVKSSSSDNSSNISQPTRTQYPRVEMHDRLAVASDPYFVRLIAGLPVCKDPVNISAPASVQTNSALIDIKDLNERLNEINFDDLADQPLGYLSHLQHLRAHSSAPASVQTNSAKIDLKDLNECLNEINFDDLEDDIPSYLTSKEMTPDEIRQLPVSNSPLNLEKNKVGRKLADYQ
jgi:hypothetical protein